VSTTFVYPIAANAGTLPSSYIPFAVPSSQYGNWTTLDNKVLGIVGQPSVSNVEMFKVLT